MAHWLVTLSIRSPLAPWPPLSSSRDACPLQEALEAGYRLLDCAEYYENETGVGEAITASGLPREEIVIVSKIWNSTMYKGEAAIRARVKQQLQDLSVDYIDIYLVHWPVVAKVPGGTPVFVGAYPGTQLCCPPGRKYRLCVCV